MSHLLWKCYWENDVDRFRRLLAPAGYSQNLSKSPAAGVGGSSAFGSSPRATPKLRKAPGFSSAAAGPKSTGSSLGKAEVNSRDHAGLTILLRAASSTLSTAVPFVQALLDHPAIDIYVQDYESGWNPLHRALYNGNISIARLLLEKERNDLTNSLGGATPVKVGQLIKTKDHEGNSPFDVYNATIALRVLKADEDHEGSEKSGSDTDEGPEGEDTRHHGRLPGLGEEAFTFGSNNNFTLGLGDEDDRQFPERIQLKRPDHLVQRFYDQYLEENNRQSNGEDSLSLDSAGVPALIQNRPLVIQDVVLSKLHSAVLTTDPVSNLYVCGIGRGGRLGLGDENTRFNFIPVQGGLSQKKVVQVSLGQNHSMAVTSAGELWTWGMNTYSQLGFALPPPAKSDEEPTSAIPRQVFGPLKKEIIVGVAASAIHSVAHTGSSLFCWGKNVGQLALMDADSRSLEVQTIPRKVAATLLSSHSSIVMVSAIDKATSCLFEDHTVCVFTSYGYNMIKFSSYDPFTNSPLRRSVQLSMSSRYDSGRRGVRQIASGGETIAAVTGSGDLFTMILNHKVDGNQSATSTTNPSKIKDAVTTPQCIWSSKKDGVKSVTVGENGSVMISTQSGAVWRRIKRPRAKDTKSAGVSDSKRKDFKFQRVPYITDIVAVRSSAFGAYAAVRKDCDVTREQLVVDAPTLWEDVAPLLPLAGFKALNSKARENKGTWKFHDPEVLRGRVDALAYEVLTSTDLDQDLQAHLTSWSFQHEGLGTVIRTATYPKLAIPVHSWILSARSPQLRAGQQRFMETGVCEIPDLLSISQQDGAVSVELTDGVDIITLINLVVYMYSDKVIPAWNFTRQSKPLAHRYRQVRTELMKLATKLGMVDLEAAVRTQTSPARSMNRDFRIAIEDPAFFADGDVLLELGGDEIPVHSVMLCQRCPWFKGLFNGRSQGMWLESRRAAQNYSGRINLDMKHMNPESFHYVLQHLYSDVGEELFNDVIADNIDDFSELVMDVMSLANELMLDRLSQICQKVIGRFVTTRNISTLLNLISPCSVTEFKDKGLEYICLQMESMLENHLLDNLDEDLLLELDGVVRDNQLARCPFARSGRVDLLLHERNPELAQEIDEERQRRVKEIAFRAAQRDDERKLSSSFKVRFGSLEDTASISPTPDRARRKSKAVQNEPFSPQLRPKDSYADLIFDMDDEGSPGPGSPASPSPQPLRSSGREDLDHLPALSGPWRDSKGKVVADSTTTNISPHALMPRSNPPPTAPSAHITRRIPSGGNPWGPSAPPPVRLDLRQVLAESRPTQSALSAGLAAEKKDTATKAAPKISQKERKKQLQQLQIEEASRQESQSQRSQSPWVRAGEKNESPWQKGPSIPKTPSAVAVEPAAGPLEAPPKPKQLLVAEMSSRKSMSRRTASPDTRFSGQKARPGIQAPTVPTQPSHNPPAPYSKSYIKRAPKPEQEMGLGLADITGEQRREQQVVREAVAKRSLQEIQQEQAFQEWWDQESRRTQEEEARRVAREEGKDKKKESGANSSRRGRNKLKGNGGANNNDVGGGGTVGGSNNAQEAGPSSGRGRGRGHRGKP
ncbi:hypothetical protein GGS23DRAFT_380692 [Durotheca rogersii]|uniref:uncharacterized protein n=1 Tax=Durotheca rogersii TaxID=419775 RepID=UPI002220CD21|nr:uncharacterized protein GGS23DRAFT_380692 [Durotheca rogersii]KAI5866307.1 hypothetical protein GGS23DRAFT_380692 [Durotheca rogersii]